MANLELKPDPFMAGAYQISAEALNKLLRATPRQIRGGGATQVSDFGDRVIVNSKEVSNSLPFDGGVRQFVVLAEYDNCLICSPFINQINPGTSGLIPQKYNPSLGQGSQLIVYVAKPFNLQRLPWDGKSVILNGKALAFAYTTLGSRTVVDPLGNKALQVIAPSYYAGEVITCVNVRTGYTDIRNAPIVWQDMNCAARVWATASGNGDQTNFQFFPITQASSFNGAAVAHIGNLTADGPDHTHGVIAPSYVLSWAGLVLDTNGYYNPSQPTRLTILQNGIYKFVFTTRWASMLASNSVQYCQVETFFAVNGVPTLEGNGEHTWPGSLPNMNTSSDINMTTIISAELPFQKNDYVEAIVRLTENTLVVSGPAGLMQDARMSIELIKATL